MCITFTSRCFYHKSDTFSRGFPEFCSSNYTMGMTKFMGSKWHWSFDFFLFKPSLLPPTIFTRRMSGSVERQFSNNLKANHINILKINRYEDDHFFTNRVDNIGLLHVRNAENASKIFFK